VPPSADSSLPAVQRARQEFLARAALAKQQYGRVGRRNFLDGPAKAADRVAHADDALERHCPGTLAQPPILLLELANAQCTPHHDGKDAGVERLVIEVGRPETHGGHGQLARIVLGHGDDLGVGRDVEDLPQELETLRRYRRLVGRPQVEQHHIRFRAAHGGECLLGGL